MSAVRTFIAVVAAAGTLVLPAPADAAARKSLTLLAGENRSFAEEGECNEREVKVTAPGHLSWDYLQGTIVLASGRGQGKKVGELTWTRSSGLYGDNWEQIGTDWMMRGEYAGRKVKYRIYAIADEDFDGHNRRKVITSPWYYTRVSSKLC